MTQAMIIAASAAGTLIFYLFLFWRGKKILSTILDRNPEEVEDDNLEDHPIDLLLDRIEEAIKEDPDGWLPWGLQTPDTLIVTRGCLLVGFEYKFEQAINLKCKACGIFIEPSGIVIYRDHSIIPGPGNPRYFEYQLSLEENQIDRVKELYDRLIAERGIRLIDRASMEKAAERQQRKQQERELNLSAFFAYRDRLHEELEYARDTIEHGYLSNELKIVNGKIEAL